MTEAIYALKHYYIKEGETLPHDGTVAPSTSLPARTQRGWMFGYLS